MSNNLTENLKDSLEGKVDRLISVVQSMDSRLETLDTKVDKRLRETQPIWEAVQAQLSEVIEVLQQHGRVLQQHGEVLQQHGEVLQQHGESLERLSEDVRALRVEVASLRADTEKSFRTFDRRMERQIGEFERLHAYQRDLEDRVDKIEKISTP